MRGFFYQSCKGCVHRILRPRFSGQAPTVVERIRDAIEPDIGIATVVNDGSIYLALSTW